MKFKNILTYGLVGLLSALLAVGLYKIIDKNDSNVPLMTEANEVELASYEASSMVAPFDFTMAAEKGLPAVVHIRSDIETQTTSSGERSPFEEFFGDMFGGPRDSEPRRGQGFGSGVIISSDGHVITNNHVIADANEINVTLYNNKEYKAELVGTDPTTDIALLKISGQRFSFLQIADSDKLKIGEWVAAIGNPSLGNPYTLKSSVTAGIVSAIGRDIDINQEQLAIETFIQTDAVINKGNSGGALVNVNGDLVGINTAISTPTGFYAGYGFAVPSNLVKKVITDLKEHGEVQRALLGIQYQDITTVRNRGGDMETSEKEGLWIADISEGGSADKAGLKRGDVLVKVDGTPVIGGNQSKLQEIIGRKRPGDRIAVVYKRSGNERTANVVLQSAEDVSANYARAVGLEKIDELGISIRNLNADESDEYDLSGGVRIEEMNPNGLLYQTYGREIGRNFIITRINDIEVKSVTDAQRAISKNSNFVKIDGFNEGRPNSRQQYSLQITK